jgi:hypothetical protein
MSDHYFENENGCGRISATPTPDPLSFCGDLDFSGEVPALSFLVAPESLKSLLLGNGDRFLRITQREIFSLLRLIVLNPESSTEKKNAAKSYLSVVLENPVISDADRKIVSDLLEQ